jgi:hypothetical protein
VPDKGRLSSLVAPEGLATENLPAATPNLLELREANVPATAAKLPEAQASALVSTSTQLPVSSALVSTSTQLPVSQAPLAAAPAELQPVRDHPRIVTGDNPQPLSLGTSDHAGAVVPNAKVAALPPVVPSPLTSDPQPQIEAALDGLDCARVNAKWNAADGSVALSGHVRSEGDRRRLVERVSSVADVEQVDATGLSVLGEPYCRLLAFLGRPELKRSEDQRHDIAALGVLAQAGISHYAAGTVLQLTLTAPEFESYIYVDYFSSDGRVYHLLPTDRLDNRFRPDERISIGGEHGRGRRAVISPPFGLDVVVAIASSEALFVRPRPASEAAVDYLAAFGARLRQWRESGLHPHLEYAYYLTYTTPTRAPVN